jgi:hypothetical protein
MSGLIWGALGKSLADTGSMIGSMYARQGEQEALAAREDARTRALAEREDQRAANALKNQESMIDYREQKAKSADEALQQRVIKERAAAQAVPEDTSKAMGDYGLVRNANTRLQETTESLENARSAGAHSTTVKGFESDLKELQTQREAVLKEIKEQHRTEEVAKTQATRDRQVDAMFAKIGTQGAGKDQTLGTLGELRKAAQTGLADARKALSEFDKLHEGDLDKPGKEKLKAQRDALNSEVTAARTDLTTVRDRFNQRLDAEAPGAKKPDATSTSLPEPKSADEVAKLKPGTRFKAPDGSIRYR